MQDFRYPQLVRVVWRNRSTRKQRSFVAGVVAQSSEHAHEIADAVVICMVPSSLPVDLWFQTAELGRNATQQDMHARDTPWLSFYRERLNVRSSRGV